MKKRRWWPCKIKGCKHKVSRGLKAFEHEAGKAFESGGDYVGLCREHFEHSRAQDWLVANENWEGSGGEYL